MSHSASVVLAGTVLTSLAWGQQITQPVGITEPDASSLNWRELHGFNPVPPRRGLTGGLRSAPILYVDQSAPPGGDGSSWELAYRDLQQALADAQADPTVVEIRVAEGTYHPDAGTGDRGAEFLVVSRSNLAVLGGFPSGGAEPNERDPAAHPTILSGDLAGDDTISFEMLEFDDQLEVINYDTAGVHFENIADNSFTVLGASASDETVVIDGFVVTGGHDPERGGGLLAINAAIRLRQMVFEGNSAPDGGAVYLNGTTSPVTLENCRFVHNDSTSYGGAIALWRSYLNLTDCSFFENSGMNGGCVYVDDGGTRPQITVDGGNFTQNFSRTNGGAVYLETYSTCLISGATFSENASYIHGAAIKLGYEGSEFTNCVFELGKVPKNGGATTGGNHFTFTECVFRQNQAGEFGGAVNIGDYIDFTTCVFEGNYAGFDGGAVKTGYSVVMSDCSLTGNSVGRNGGAAWVENMQVLDCTFEHNSAKGTGGAMYAQGCDIQRSKFTANTADAAGGGIWVDGGVIESSIFSENIAGDVGGGVAGTDSNDIISCVFIGNFAATAGGGVSFTSTGNEIINCTLVANDADHVGGFYAPLTNTVRDTILWDNADTFGSAAERAQIGGALHTVSFSTIMGLSDYYGSGNSAADPRFLDPVGPDGTPGTGDEDLQLASDSPCIDIGSTSAVVDNSGPFDVLGRPRYAAFGGSTEPVVDHGAYEAQDCDSDHLIDSESIAFGHATDCNEDGIPDSCQIGTLLGADLLRMLAPDRHTGDNFGISIDMAGDILVVGANLGDSGVASGGSAYVYNGFTADYRTTLFSSDIVGADSFGQAVATNGTLIAVGAPDDDDLGTSSGSIYLFDGQTGQELTKITPSDGAAGDEFGTSVVISDQYLIIGAPYDDDNGSAAGSIYVMDLTGNLIHKLHSTDPNAGDYLGISLALRGDILVAGATGDDQMGSGAGAAYLFDLTTGTQLFKLRASNGVAGDSFGYSVAIEDGMVAVGSPNYDSSGISNVGAVYVFDVSTGNQTAVLVSSTPISSSYAGYSVAIVDGIVAAGATLFQVSISQTGAVFLFDPQTGEQIGRLVATQISNGRSMGTSLAADSGRLAIGAEDDRDGSNYPGSAYLATPQVPDVDGDGRPDTCACLPDMNQDGYLNFFDVQVFLNYYSAHGELADLNSDGLWDFYDVQAFLGAFSIGCP